jgi:hypothetical protein
MTFADIPSSGGGGVPIYTVPLSIPKVFFVQFFAYVSLDTVVCYELKICWIQSLWWIKSVSFRKIQILSIFACFVLVIDRCCTRNLYSFLKW